MKRLPPTNDERAALEAEVAALRDVLDEVRQALGDYACSTPDCADARREVAWWVEARIRKAQTRHPEVKW